MWREKLTKKEMRGNIIRNWAEKAVQKKLERESEKKRNKRKYNKKVD